jgi:hypothetical protein
MPLIVELPPSDSPDDEPLDFPDEPVDPAIKASAVMLFSFGSFNLQIEL